MTKIDINRVYRIPIPEGRLIVCRKVLLALTEWRARARGIQHFDEESGRATWDDLFVIQAGGDCRIEVLLRENKSGETFWAPAHYDESGEYAETLRKPGTVSVVVRDADGDATTTIPAPAPTDAADDHDSEYPDTDSDSDTDQRWQPEELQPERPKRDAPPPAIGRKGKGGGTHAAVTMNLWGQSA